MIALAVASCTPKAPQISHPDWNPEVRDNVNAFLKAHKADKQKNYVVFDFDNTSSIFDITENQMYRQLEEMRFEGTPDMMREALRQGLNIQSGIYDDMLADIDADYTALYEAFGPFSWHGVESVEALHTDIHWSDFAAKMMGVYLMILKHETPAAAYNWDKFWLCGMTDAQIDSMSVQTHAECSSIPTSSSTWETAPALKTRAGSYAYPHVEGFSVTPNIVELWKALSEAGLDVWVCSASGIRQVKEAVDMFDLHEYCSGVIAMTMAHDSLGRIAYAYDYDGRALIATEDGWKEGDAGIGALTAGPGKVTAIDNAIAPLYGGRQPVACFMDSTGDFNFCTEYSSTELVICFNRGNRKVTDGGALVAEVAVYEADDLGYDYAKARAAGDILYLLQGRDDNGMRGFRPSRSTLTFGSAEEKLFAGDDNYAQYNYMKDSGMSVKDAFALFAIRTAAEDSPIGVAYGFLDEYNGYMSR